MGRAPNIIALRYPAKCGICGTGLVVGAFAAWDRTLKSATCESCVADADESATTPFVEIDRGRAGGSATREWKRRHELREARIRARHPRLGRLLLALSSDPQSTTSWATGARGERTIGESLDRLRGEGIAVLHDRRLPGSRTNIDHLVVSRAGVFVIDTKNYKGRVAQRDVGGFFRTELRLYVDGRDQTKLIEQMRRQVDAVRRPLAVRDDWRAVPVTPVLLFMSADNWSVLRVRPLRFGDVYVLWGKALGKLIRAEGCVANIAVEELERALAVALPPA